MRCEDYPCCGHTDGLPCDWTPENVYNDPHLLCDHETGVCEVEEVCEDYPPDCPFGGCDDCRRREAEDYGDDIAPCGDLSCEGDCEECIPDSGPGYDPHYGPPEAYLNYY